MVRRVVQTVPNELPKGIVIVGHAMVVYNFLHCPIVKPDDDFDFWESETCKSDHSCIVENKRIMVQIGIGKYEELKLEDKL